MTGDAATDKTPLRFPDFLGIGAQKAGTTWLHKKLEQHPDIWMPPLKEIHYFDVLHLDYVKDPATGLTGMDVGRIDKALVSTEWALKSSRTAAGKIRIIHLLALIGLRELTDEWYGTIFRHAGTGTVCGEITPEYALLPPAGIEHIVRLRPDVKIIFIIRDPIDRGWSDLRMMQRRTNSSGAHELHQIGSRQFLQRADFMATIERFRQFIPAENMLILFFDDVVERPAKLVLDVCNFLAVDPARAKFKGLDKPVHEGQPGELPRELYDEMRARLRPAYERLLTLNSPIVKQWYARHYG
ncbi:MAG TPA: sulfotransferase [Rhizomicrobium sp.]